MPGLQARQTSTLQLQERVVEQVREDRGLLHLREVPGPRLSPFGDMSVTAHSRDITDQVTIDGLYRAINFTECRLR